MDDCYTVSRSSQISLGELLLTINSINSSIHFTIEYSKDQIPFLDILIKRNENGIWIDLYHKPTDTQRCLPFTSSHPNHCKLNIPFCLAWRICTIAETNAEKLKNLENNLNICSTIKSLVNCLKNNNVSSFHNINLIQSNCQPPNLKKLLTDAEYGDVLSVTINFSDKWCGCCNYLLINDHYTFKNVKITF